MIIAYASPQAGSAPVWMAREAGIFLRNGLNVEPKLISGSSNVVEELLADRVQFGHIAAPSVVKANLRGGDLVYLTGGINYIIQMIVVTPDITEPRDLIGKVMAFGAPGDIDEHVLRYILPRWDLRPGVDVPLIPGPRDQRERITQMQQKIFHGTSLAIPAAFEAKKLGLKILLDIGSLRLPYQLGALVARRAFVKANRDLVCRAVKSYIEGIHLLRTDRGLARKVLVQYGTCHDLEIVDETIEHLNRFFERSPYPSPASLQSIINSMIPETPAARSAKGTDFVEPRFVRELEQEGFVEKLYGT
jgi:ABC-type nitrate/sulfonate/bicarbonate transport system substrate-binding protein